LTRRQWDILWDILVVDYLLPMQQVSLQVQRQDFTVAA
jgi:hypothetical protein